MSLDSRSVSQDGFAVVRGVLGDAQRCTLLAALGPATGAGRRGMLALPAVARLARSPQMVEIVRPHLATEPMHSASGGTYLAAEPRPVRAIFFNKSAEANWLVAWHQDLTIAVRARDDVPGFGPWSTKNGILHVQPPVPLLEQMLAVRLHLDDANASNGALRVVPGSHRYGRLSQEQAAELRSARGEQVCCVSAGDAVLMRPLTLHASGRSASDAPRRVLHIEYAGVALPAGLQWHEAA